MLIKIIFNHYDNFIFKKNHKEIIELLRNAIEGELAIKTLQGRIKTVGNIIKVLKPLRYLVGSL